MPESALDAHIHDPASPELPAPLEIIEQILSPDREASFRAFLEATVESLEEIGPFARGSSGYTYYGLEGVCPSRMCKNESPIQSLVHEYYWAYNYARENFFSAMEDTREVAEQIIWGSNYSPEKFYAATLHGHWPDLKGISPFDLLDFFPEEELQKIAAAYEKALNKVGCPSQDNSASYLQRRLTRQLDTGKRCRAISIQNTVEIFLALEGLQVQLDQDIPEESLNTSQIDKILALDHHGKTNIQALRESVTIAEQSDSVAASRAAARRIFCRTLGTINERLPFLRAIGIPTLKHRASLKWEKYQIFKPETAPGVASDMGDLAHMKSVEYMRYLLDILFYKNQPENVIQSSRRRLDDLLKRKYTHFSGQGEYEFTEGFLAEAKELLESE